MISKTADIFACFGDQLPGELSELVLHLNFWKDSKDQNELSALQVNSLEWMCNNSWIGF